MSAIAEIAVAVATSLAGPCFERIVVPFLGFLCSCFLLEDNIREMRATRSTVNTDRERQLMSGWLSRADVVEGEFEVLRKSRCSFLPISSQYSNISKRHGLSRDAASLTNNMRSYRESLSGSGAGDDIEQSSSAGGERATPTTTQVGDHKIREGSESRSNLERTAPKTMQVVPKEIAEGSRSNSVRDTPETKLVVVEEIGETALLVVEEIGEGSESNMARATPETMQGVVVQETGGGSGSNLARSEPETMQMVIQDTREGSGSISVRDAPESILMVVQEIGKGSESNSARATPETMQGVVEENGGGSESNSPRTESGTMQGIVEAIGERSESNTTPPEPETSQVVVEEIGEGSRSNTHFYTDMEGVSHFSLSDDKKIPNRPYGGPRTTATHLFFSSLAVGRIVHDVHEALKSAGIISS